MKLKQLIKQCFTLCNLSYADGLFDGTYAVAEQDANVPLFCALVNNVVEHIYRDVACAKAQTTVQAVGGRVSLEQLPVLKVLNLTDGNGADIPFDYTDNQTLTILAKNSYGYALTAKLNLTYAKLPPQFEWEDEVTLPTPRITPSIVCLGVQQMYCQQCGDVAMAEVWGKHFNTALLNAVTSVDKSAIMPCRRWA